MYQQPAGPPLVVLSLTKKLVAMNAHTGQRVWEYEAPAQGRLYVEHGLVFYCGYGEILCLDYLTGAFRWKAPIPSPISAQARVLLFAGCVIILGMGEAVCLNAQSGVMLWHDKFKGYGNVSGALAAPGVDSQIDHQ